MAEQDNTEYGLLGIGINDPVTEILPVIDASLTPNAEVDMDELPTYHWNGATMKQKIGDVLPIVYGRHALAPTLINAYIEEGEHETLNLLLAWCEGEIESITNIKIGGNPIESFFHSDPNDPYGESAELSVRTGKIEQEEIQHFDELHTITPVSQVLLKGIPYQMIGTISTCRAIRVELSIDKLYEIDAITGNNLSWYFAVEVKLRKVGEGAFRTLGIIETNKKTTTVFKRYFKTEYLEAGQYEVIITKVSDDQDEGENPVHLGEVTLVSIDEITTEQLSYPTVALTGIRVLAFQDLQGSIPNITGIITGRKVRCPKVTFDIGGTDVVDWEQYYYDGSDFRRLGNDALLYWDGSTYIDQWCANPVWCLRDLLTNKRYGLGDYIPESKVDAGSFFASAMYCEEAVNNDEGNKEKRFRLDCVLDSASPATDVIGSIIKSFRGIIYMSEGVIRVNVEKQETPKAVFNMGNIVAGSFALQYQGKKKPNVISAQYTNKDKSYMRESVEIASSEQELRDVVASTQSVQWYGVTRLTQVLRESRILLNKINNNTKVIHFKAYFDSVLLQPYDVIGFQHDVPGWGSGGRITEFSSTLNVRLDTPVVLDPGSAYTLTVRNAITDALETRNISNIPGVYTSLDVATPFSFIPQENDLWSLSTVGANTGTQLYRITNISKKEEGDIDISAVEYTDDIYDPSVIIIPQDKYSHLILDIPKVQNLKLEEAHNKLPSGNYENKIQVSFQIAPVTAKYIKQATRYEIWLSDNEGASWNMVGSTDREYMTIAEMVSVGVLYRVAVVSVTESGEKNPIATSPQQTISIQGITTAPSKVVNFQYTFTDEISLTWDKNPEADIVGYEIRTNNFSWLSDTEGLVWRGDASKFIIVRPTARQGVTYYIRAYNQQGIVSSEGTSIEPVNPRPNAPSLFAVTLFQKVFLSWLPVNDADIVEYEIWQNTEPVFFGVERQEDERLYARIKATNFVAEVPYQMTYYRICAVDRFGRGAFSNIVSAERLDIESQDIGLNAILSTNIDDEAISTPKLRAGAITTEKIATKAVVANNIDVAQLSAISADLGTIRSGEIIGALIKTSNDPFRVEMDSFGLRSYDMQGRKTVELSQGNLRLYNPEAPEYYSSLDSGGLVFNTPYGSTPYATRLCAGVATAGQKVCLSKWSSKPEVILGIKRLQSYNSGRPESSQEWCVYSDNLQYYDFGSGNFGWSFDVRAKLVITGGTRIEQYFDVPFGTSRCTGSGVCQVQVGACVQVWCHQVAPDPICYACICYEIAYRQVGAGSWTRACYEWLSPHDTIGAIKQTYKLCHTVALGAMGQWEVTINERGRHYVASPFQTGGYITVICCTPYTIDQSCCGVAYVSGRFGGSISAISPGTNRSASASQDVYVDFADYGRADLVVLSSAITNCAYGTVLARITAQTSRASASVSGLFGGGISKSGDFYSAWQATGCWTATKQFASYQTRVLGFRLSAYASDGYISGYTCALASVSGSSVQVVNYKCCIVRTCYTCTPCCLFVGSACNADIRLFSSMRDIVGNEVVLDPAGEINYLAVAYR